MHSSERTMDGIAGALEEGMERRESRRLPSAQSKRGLFSLFLFPAYFDRSPVVSQRDLLQSHIYITGSLRPPTHENTVASEITPTAPLAGLNLNCGLMFLMIRPFSNPAWGLLGPPWQGSALSPGIF